MFERVTIRVSDLRASQRFYATVLPVIGLDQPTDFALEEAGAEGDVTQGLHVGFVAPSRAHVDEFWRTGVGAGYRDDGEPGLRPQYLDDYYGGFLLDPDGNSIEAVHYESMRRSGAVDHLWIRVADVSATGDFYERVGPDAGFRAIGRFAEPERVSFHADGGGSFSFVAGTPTRNAHLSFAGRRALDLRDPDGNRVEVVAGP